MTDRPLKAKSLCIVAPPGGFKCTACGVEYQMHMPCSLGVWAAAANAFCDEHERCKPREGSDAGVAPMTFIGFTRDE